MSAGTLRRASALMRERAAAALRGPWEALGSEHEIGFFDVVQPSDIDREVAGRLFPVNAEHIASWHPTVALAVADLIDTILKVGPVDGGAEWDATVTLARTYLGESA